MTKKQKTVTKLAWRFPKSLIDDVPFLNYVGYFGAFIELSKKTLEKSLQEYYVMKTSTMFSKIKSRLVTEGSYYTLYKGDDKVIAEESLALYEYLNNINEGGYVKDIQETMNSDFSNFLEGKSEKRQVIDPNLNVEIFVGIKEGYDLAGKQMLDKKNKEADEDRIASAINKLVEQGISRKDAKHIMEASANGEDVESLIEKALPEENDTLNEDIIPDEIDVDDFLRECGLDE